MEPKNKSSLTATWNTTGKAECSSDTHHTVSASPLLNAFVNVVKQVSEHELSLRTWLTGIQVLGFPNMMIKAMIVSYIWGKKNCIRACITAQQEQKPPAATASHVVNIPLFPFLSGSLLMTWGKQWKMAPVFGPLPVMWEFQRRVLAPSFVLAYLWPSWSTGESKPEDGRFPVLIFQIKKPFKKNNKYWILRVKFSSF